MKFRLLLVIALAAAFVGTTAGQAMANQLVVDDDHAQCPNATFTAIQPAVNASGPNDTIKVCPGTYNEQVRIAGSVHNGLTLYSSTPFAAVVKWPVTESFPLALVDINGSNDVTIRAFTLRGPFFYPSCLSDRHEGVLVEGGSHRARIFHNHIVEIRNSIASLAGCQDGDAVSVGRRQGPGAPTPGTAYVIDNTIENYEKNGVQVFNAGSYALVAHNTLVGPTIGQSFNASNGIVVVRQAAADVLGNSVRQNHYLPGQYSSGILVGDVPANSSSVLYNNIFDNDYGIAADTNSGIAYSHNYIHDNVNDGINLCGDTTQGCGALTDAKVRDNFLFRNQGSGISLVGADNNFIAENRLADNGKAPPDTTDGIRVDSASSGNHIRENRAHGNVTHDCHDDSIGTGSGGTGNLWIHDRGNTQNRSGLCRPHEGDD